MRTRHLSTAFALAFLLLPAHASSPSTEQLQAQARAQRVFATHLYLDDLRRAEAVTYAVLKAASPYCGTQRKYSLGVPPLPAQGVPQELRRGFGEMGEIPTDAWRFVHVAINSPALAAGVREGDILVSMKDRATGKPVSPGWTFERPANTFVSNSPIALTLLRGKDSVSLQAMPQLICNARLQLHRSRIPSIRVTAGTLTLTTGLLAFLRNDDELALLIANAWARDQLHLMQAKARTDVVRRKTADVLRSQEEQADYLSAYLTVAAGFDLGRAETVWKRIAGTPGESPDDVSNHYPLSQTRAVRLVATYEEINRKAMKGERIIPDITSLPSFVAVNPDTITLNEPALSPAMTSKPSRKEDARLTDLTDIPFVDNEGVAGYQRFLSSPLRPRAFAVGPGRRGVWSFKFGANASADALAHCALLATRGQCYLYAVDDQVVWNTETALYQPEKKQLATSDAMLLQAPPKTNFALVGDISAVPLPQTEIAKYRAFLEKPSPRTFVITQGGTGSYWLGPAAMQDALAYCARVGDACWLYAVNDAVVWSEDPRKRISNRTQLMPENDESGFLEK